MKWNPTNLLTTRLLLGLLGISPILLLSNTTQVLSAPANQLSTDAIHKAAAQSTQRAISTRQQPSPYPDSLPKGVGVKMQSSRTSLPYPLLQNRACQFPGTRLLNHRVLVSHTIS